MARARQAPTEQAASEPKAPTPIKQVSIVVVSGEEISSDLEGVFLKSRKDEFIFRANCGEEYSFKIEKMKQLIALFDNNDEGPTDDQIQALIGRGY